MVSAPHTVRSARKQTGVGEQLTDLRAVGVGEESVEGGEPPPAAVARLVLARAWRAQVGFLGARGPGRLGEVGWRARSGPGATWAEESWAGGWAARRASRGWRWHECLLWKWGLTGRRRMLGWWDEHPMR